MASPPARVEVAARKSRRESRACMARKDKSFLQELDEKKRLGSAPARASDKVAETGSIPSL
jgi:hypothetical protein